MTSRLLHLSALLLLVTFLSGCALEASFYGHESRDFPTPPGVEDLFISVHSSDEISTPPGTALSGPGPHSTTFVHCWLFPAPPPAPDQPGTPPKRSPAILFCHGARTQIDSIGPALAPMAERAGAALMLVSYRGFGRSSPAEPSRVSTTNDALAALAALRARPDIDPDRIVVFGYSLGGIPALACATRYKLAGVVVGGTYSTAAAALRDRDMAHLAWLLGDTHDPAVNVTRMVGITPLYLFHGETDSACLVHHAYTIAAAAALAGVPLRLDIVPNAGHRSIFRDAPWVMERVAAFVRGVTQQPPIPQPAAPVSQN